MSGYAWIVWLVAGALALIIVFSMWSDATRPPLVITTQPAHKLDLPVPVQTTVVPIPAPAAPVELPPAPDGTIVHPVR